MPEGLEAEIWRCALGDVIGREITDVDVDERVVDPGLAAALTGRTMTAARRVGKVIVIETDGLPFGLHFGMTGRLVIDGRAPIARLEYASGADRPEWDRLRLFTRPAAPDQGPAIRMNDPRRLGHITLDPDLGQLGTDLFDIDRDRLSRALSGRHTAVKNALLNQHVVAGLGNLCADEVLWWSGIAPGRPVDTLSTDEVDRLAGAIRRRMQIMLGRGGSTMGTLTPDVRAACPPCPRDGFALRRTSIGGRTAVWCPEHQR